MPAIDLWDPLAVWLWLAAAQSTFWLLVGLGAAPRLAHRPAFAHAALFLCVAAAVLAPALSLVVQKCGWGVLEAGPPAVVYRAAGEAVVVRALPGEVIAWRLIAVWYAVAALLLARLGVAYARGVRFVREAQPVDDPNLLASAARAATDLGLRRVPRLVRHPRASVPHLWGLGRPVVVLPDGPLPGGADLAAVLRHEFAHARRGDAVTALLAEVVAALLWWNPLAWVARRQLIRSAEFACDDWALAGGGRSSTYASTLLALSPLRPAPRLMASASGDLFARVVRLTTGARPARPGIDRRWAAAVAAAVIVCVVALGLTQARSQTGPGAFGPLADRPVAK